MSPWGGGSSRGGGGGLERNCKLKADGQTTLMPLVSISRRHVPHIVIHRYPFQRVALQETSSSKYWFSLHALIQVQSCAALKLIWQYQQLGTSQGSS